MVPSSSSGEMSTANGSTNSSSVCFSRLCITPSTSGKKQHAASNISRIFQHNYYASVCILNNMDIFTSYIVRSFFLRSFGNQLCMRAHNNMRASCGEMAALTTSASSTQEPPEVPCSRELDRVTQLTAWLVIKKRLFHREKHKKWHEIVHSKRICVRSPIPYPLFLQCYASLCPRT